MENVNITVSEHIARLTIDRPPVNALNPVVIENLVNAFSEIETDDNVRALVLRGEGSFFSFGFDVPELMEYSKDDFHEFVSSFSQLIRRIFIYDKPVVAAVSGHCVAGGAVLALCCDYRIMLDGKPKIALNELSFGSTVFSSIAQFLIYAVGNRNAERIIYSGNMYSAGDAKVISLVDEAADTGTFDTVVSETSSQFARNDLRAFSRIKKLLRQETLNVVERTEQESIADFVKMWYSDETRKKLAEIRINR